jgi:hypothetical protein
VVEETIKKLADIEDITQRNQLAFKIFGRSASEIAPLLALGSAGIEEATQKAEKLGLVLSRDALEAANAFRVEFDTLKATFSTVTNEIGQAFLPVATQLVEILQNNIIPAVRNIIDFLGNLSTTTKTTITVIAGLVAGIGPLLFGIGALTKAIPFLLAGLNALKLGFLLLSGPVGLTVIALSSLAIGFNLAEKAGKQYQIINEKISQSNEQVKTATKKLADTQKFLNGLLLTYNELTEEEKRQAQEQLTIRINQAKSLLQLAKASREAAIEEAIRLTVFDKIKQSIGLGTGVFDRLKQIAGDTSQNINNLASEIEALEESFNSLGVGIKLTEGLKTSTTGLKNEINELSLAYQSFLDQLLPISDRDISDRALRNLNLENQGIQDFGDLSGGIAPVQEFADQLSEIVDNQITPKTLELQNLFTALGNQIVSSFNISNNALQGFIFTLLNNTPKIIQAISEQVRANRLAAKANVASASKEAAADAIVTGGKAAKALGPVGLALLPVFIGGALALVQNAFSKIGGNVPSGGGGGVGSGVGSTFEGGGTQFLSNNIELALVPEITGDSIRFVLDKSNQYRN